MLRKNLVFARCMQYLGFLDNLACTVICYQMIFLIFDCMNLMTFHVLYADMLKRGSRTTKLFENL